jgi:hypothetical protein
MTMPSYCRSCGVRLRIMDRVYCAAPSCQEEARIEVMGSSGRFRAIESELGFGAEDVSSMPKERLLALLDKDARKYDLEGSSPDLGYMTSFVVLSEKVRKHPWDDCAKFLAERSEIIRRIEVTEQAAKAQANAKASVDRTEKSRGVYETLDAAMSFGPLGIDPGVTMVLQTMPQRRFRCTKMSIGHEIAPYFLIHELRVGKDWVMNSIPARAFVEDSVGVGLSFDVIVGSLMTMIVENTSREKRMFAAMFFEPVLVEDDCDRARREAALARVRAHHRAQLVKGKL